jgi:CheY-like chemotaxis protein
MKKCDLIVLIDDNEFDCFVNKKIIEKLEFASELNVLKNGFEGINFLKILFEVQKSPDLIFLDLDMPVMNGFEFLRQFNELAKPPGFDTKVIVLTSSSNPSDFKLAKDLGCDAYLEKPLTREKVKEVYDSIFVNL